MYNRNYDDIFSFVFVGHSSNFKSLDDYQIDLDDLALPSGYEKKKDEKTGRCYYVNHMKKTTSWVPPAGAKKWNEYYCHDCKIMKFQGIHHCGVCKCCVQDLDHHCMFLGKCSGRDNYRLFFNYRMVGIRLFILIWNVSCMLV
eukprot:UN33440